MSLPSRLPNYAVVDPLSPWNVAGLFSTALETMSLPSRLKLRNGIRESLDQLINVLNVNGNQNIAKLRMSIEQETAPNGHHRPARLEVRAQSRDIRLPSQERRAEEPDSQDESKVKTFDMDFFPAEASDQSRVRRAIKEAHVFGQAETYRSDTQKQEDDHNSEEAGHERARRRAAGLPIIQRLVRTLSLLASTFHHENRFAYHRHLQDQDILVLSPA